MADSSASPRLPRSREALLKLHAETRRARASAALGSAEYQAAVEELARIEIEIARQERAMDPPRI